MSAYHSLRPDADTTPHIQCCAEPYENGREPIPRLNRAWQKDRERRLGYDPKKCQRRARYEIDGKPYCPTHAGQIALKEMLSRQATDS